MTREVVKFRAIIKLLEEKNLYELRIISKPK